MTAVPPAARRLTSAAALAAVAALAASFVVLPADAGGASAADVAARYAAAGYRPAVLVQVAGVVAALVAACGLAALLRPAGPAVRGLLTAGGTTATALSLTGYAVIATLTAGSPDRGGDVVLALYDLSSIAFAFGAAGWAVALAAAAVGLLRTRALGAWAGWAAALLAVVQAVAAGSLADGGFLGVHGDAGFLAVVLLHAWLLAVGVALLRRVSPPRQAAGATPAAAGGARSPR